MRAIKYYYSGVAQLVRAPGLRSGGRKFESCHFELLVTTPLLFYMRLWWNGRHVRFRF